jgi:glycine dehydrogenase subunit 1
MRYLPLSDQDRLAMLDAIGVSSVDDLYCDVPKAARLKANIDLPQHAGEMAVERALSQMAAKNLHMGDVPSFMGAGIYHHHIPASVDYLIQRGEFLTAYTPYQPEISQGTLQYLFEFQTQVALISAMDAANASLYDGATASTEAVMMALRITKRSKAILSGTLHPHYAETIATSARFLNINLDTCPPDWRADEDIIAKIDDEAACVVVQTPGFFGHLKDLSSLAEACHAHGALLIVVVTEIVSLGAIRAPGDMGADIVAAEGQSLGNAANFGGPTVGLLCVRQKYLRQTPGRLVGQTVDADGRRGFVLTLSTREQHIRREKATSNICTNSGLCALAFTIHLTLLGEEGFTRLAHLNHEAAINLADRLSSLKGVEVINKTFFNEFTIRLTKPAAEVVEALSKQKILAGVPASRLYPKEQDLENLLLVAATECTTEDDMETFVQALGKIL